nr:adenylosuccinate synthetase [Bacteroidota bacterium]
LKWFDTIDRMRGLQLIDAEYFLADHLKQGHDILAEGAQGVMLDIDFGTYPFVTSSNTISSGVCSGLGVPPTAIRRVIGVTKAYCTRVGSGPFPSELLNADGERLRIAGNEFGSTTGRPRRCGWLDLPQLHYAAMITGCTHIAITKLDVLNEFESISVADQYQSNGTLSTTVPFDPTDQIDAVHLTHHPGWMQQVNVNSFEELPLAVRDYLTYLATELHIPIPFISIGPGRDELIVREY